MVAAMPRTKKPAGEAVDPRNGRRAELVLAAPVDLPLPRARETFQPLALTAWDGYCSDLVAGTVTPADLMIVHAWITAYDDWMVNRALADKQPLMEGSMGQMIANPLYKVASAAMALAMACARQLGIGAKNRADLGIALFTGQQKQNLAAAPVEDPEADDDDDDDDPRIVRGDPV
jgi:phage terminase small subunit